MNEEILKKGILDAYVHLRKTNSSIPSEVLDWIKDTCLEKVKNCSMPDVVGRSEQLKCDHKPKSYDKKHTSCKKCGSILQMKP